MKFKHKDNEAVGQFREQTQLLQQAIKSYDGGSEAAAQTIGVLLWVLLHDSGIMPSLLSQLDMKSGKHYLSTVMPYVPAITQAYHGLFNRDDSGSTVPVCKTEGDADNKWLTFNDWWHELVIGGTEGVFSREDIVRFSAETAGREISPESVRASLRQIAHELLVSLNINSGKRAGTRQKQGSQAACYLGDTLYFACVDPQGPEDDQIRREPRTLYTEEVMLEGGRRFTMHIVM